MADEAADVHLAGGDQRDGVAEGQRVDEGALDGQLLLVDVVGVHLEVSFLRADTEHQHLSALLGGGDSLGLGGRQADGLDDDVVGISRNLLAGGVVGFGDAELLLVALQLLVEDAGEVHLVHAVGLQQLGEDLAHEAVADDQSLLVRTQLEQVEAVHGAGHRLDGGGVAQGDVVRQLVDHGGRSGEPLGQTAVTGDADGAQVIAQLRTLGQAVLALAAVDVRIDGNTVADFDVGDLGADGCDDTGVLMAEDDWRNGRSGARTAGVQVMVGAADTCVSGVDQHLVRLNLRSVQFLDLELLDASQNQSLHDCSFLTERFCFCFPQTPCAISHTIRFSKKFCKLLFVKFFTKRVALISKASASSRRRQETTIAHKNQKEITSKTQRRATTLARTIDVFRRLQWRHEESTPAPIRNPPRTLLHR